MDVISSSVTPHTGPKPSPELLSFVKRQVRNAQLHRDAERRSENRSSIAVPAVVQPLDKHHQPVGEAFAVVARDISPKGIGLVHTERIDHKLLALQISLGGEEANLVVRVVWNMGLGPFYGIGGEFVAKWDRFPRSFDGGHGTISPARSLRASHQVVDTLPS